ncbi:hypothetical protein ACEWY4_014070 [Coilia grayii]|uniref:Protein kinase domain-containing protein n=1 Tax=Coilia grayii TaxID=363190 RepID=A0ABD1JR81_9TELE
MMEEFLADRNVWIVGSVCLIASFVWGRLRKLIGHKRKEDAKADAQTQYKAKPGDETFQVKSFKSQKKKATSDNAEEVQKLNRENFQLSYDDQNEGESSLSDLQLQEQKEYVDLVYGEKETEGEETREIDEQQEKQITVERKEAKTEETDKQDLQRQERREEVEVVIQRPEAAKDEEIKRPKEDGEREQGMQSIRIGGEEGTDVDQPQLHSDLPDSQSCEMMLSSKRHLSEEDLLREEQKKSRVEEKKEAKEEEEANRETRETEEQAEKVEKETKAEEEGEEEVEAAAGPLDLDAAAEEPVQDGEPSAEEYVIDCSPPPPAPFEHRIVTTRTQHISAYYTINKDEVLGGGRFGQVHKCVEKGSGLTLAAKIIKARSQKEKDVVKNEILVMNQLDHANLIQLYAAFESRHDITLVLEYVEGGELFDRIIDDSCNLTELDTVLFIRQICEGLQYMHRMYILHLDLKPENILCVSRETNKIKIIDFGLARRYKPREKLRINFGTPEFLAPEVINYDFVSFPTDMWSLGVITYMLLSGLSPFLGDDDSETLNNILACQWSFEEAEFAQTSDEAKDFITRLLVKSKSWRMSASQSLKHPWLSDRGLHYRLYEKQKQLNPSKDTPLPPPSEN